MRPEIVRVAWRRLRTVRLAKLASEPPMILIDGMIISGQELNNYPLAIPPLDSVAEFRVQTSNYSAEFGGNSGAVINVASKRGSNEFHATVFEFLRNDALDARNYFSTTVDPLKRNQFGFLVSGPVFLPKLYNGKNKLFGIVSYEGTRRRGRDVEAKGGW